MDCYTATEGRFDMEPPPRKPVVLRRRYAEMPTREREERQRDQRSRFKTHSQYLSWDVRLQNSRKGR